MTGWIIFGSIVLLIIIILWQSITVTFDYENKLSLKVKFLSFTVYTTDPKPKKKNKPKKAKKKKEKAEEATAKTEDDESEPSPESKEPADGEADNKKDKSAKKEKKKFKLDLEMIMDYVRSAAPPLKRLFKKIRWYDVYVDWIVASDDAAKTAITYGSICSVLYPFFEWLTTYFTAHVKEVRIEADFSKEKSDIFAYFVLKLRLSTALACVIWLAVRVLKTYFKYNQESTTQKPKAASKKKRRKASKKKGK